MFLKIITALIGLASSAAMMRYSRQVTMFTGKFTWAEQYLGSGGTHTFIRLFAAALFFVFLLYPFGYWDAWLQKNPPAHSSSQTQTPYDA